MNNDTSTGLHIRLLRPILIVFLGTVYSPSSASAAIVVSMTGAVGAGNLNGNDLAGQAFEFQGLISSTGDADDFQDFGTFVAESAFVQFSGGGRFDFEPNDLALAIFYGDFNGQFAFASYFLADDFLSPTP